MKHLSLVLTSALGLSAAAAFPATPVNWPQFRGGSASGVADGSTLPTRLSVKDNVAWVVEVPGRGWLEFQVTRERVSHLANAQATVSSHRRMELSLRDTRD